MAYLFPPADSPAVPIAGTGLFFPIHRIYCIGRNYAEHAKEMAALDIQPATDEAIFFSKPADAVVTDGNDVPYPPMTQNLHHEVEMVLALNAPLFEADADTARAAIAAYAVGCDLTRRDLQSAAKKAGSAWDTSKGFDCSAPLSALQPVDSIGHPVNSRIWLAVNGEIRQQADISDMTWSPAEILAQLSRYYRLKPGDLLFTGTPAGVGPLAPGDRVDSGIDGIGELSFTIV